MGIVICNFYLRVAVICPFLYIFLSDLVNNIKKRRKECKE